MSYAVRPLTHGAWKRVYRIYRDTDHMGTAPQHIIVVYQDDAVKVDHQPVSRAEAAALLAAARTSPAYDVEVSCL